MTILLGLLSRSDLVNWPEFVTLYVGDFLWALLVYWLFSIIGLNWNQKIVVLSALAFAFSIEISQLYHPPWLEEIRHTRLGGLVLGFGFKWSDLVAYTMGIVFGAFINKSIVSKYLNP
jgi:hypothetical protein